MDLENASHLLANIPATARVVDVGGGESPFARADYVVHDASTNSTGFKVGRCPSPVIDEVYTTRRIPRLDGSTCPMNVYIPREEGDFLYSLVRDLQPDVTVEVGM